MYVYIYIYFMLHIYIYHIIIYSAGMDVSSVEENIAWKLCAVCFWEILVKFSFRDLSLCRHMTW